MKTKVTLKNIYSLSKYDFHRSDLDMQESIRSMYMEFDALQRNYFGLADRLDELQRRLKIEEVLRYYLSHPEVAQEYNEELSYLDSSNEVTAFPYEREREPEAVESGYDSGCGMAYVLHCGKKLYFPVGWSETRAVDTYRNYIENENLLGGGFRKKAPHQYQTEDFKIEEGDVLVDVGSAEALLSLDTIERVKRVYLIESDPMWKPALHKTFEPFKEKVVIVNKYLADKNTDTMVTLENVLSDERGFPFFIKMDIEGNESMVLKSSRRFLSEQQCKVACCTYHQAGDEVAVKSLFDSIGYSTTVSDGFVLFLYGHELKPPYFRRGVVRAKRR